MLSRRRKNVKDPISLEFQKRASWAQQQEIDRVVTSHIVFMRLATKYGLDKTRRASQYWGITQKQAKSLLACDLTNVTWEDYIKCTADLCFLGYIIERSARSNS